MNKSFMCAAAAALTALVGCASDPTTTTEATSKLSGSGSEDMPPPPPPAPTSTITVTYSGGTPDSDHPTSPVMGWRCQIPQAVLQTLPLYNGGPVMTSCDITVSLTGSPPTSVSTLLTCTNSTGTSGYDHLSCSTSVSLGLVPSVTQSGYLSYGAPGAGTPDLPNDTCAAYINRALGICGQTGA